MMENIDPSVYERADEGLLRLIEKAKVGALSENEYKVYEASLKALADEMDMEEHGYARGLEAGRKEGISATVRMLVEGGMPIPEIARMLHIPEEEVEGMLACQPGQKQAKSLKTNILQQPSLPFHNQ